MKSDVSESQPRFVVKNDICIQVLEDISDNVFIIIDEDNKVLYIDYTKYEVLTVVEMKNRLNTMRSVKWRNDELKSHQIYSFEKVLYLMIEHSRNILIDEFIDNKKVKSITGLSPLVFAC